MTATNLYHVGVIVKDIREAMSHFGHLLGLTFGEPRSIPLENLEELGAVTQRTITVVYSNEGPPFLELIEAQEDGLWGIQNGEGLHHVGSYEDDLAGRVGELLAEGHTAAAKIRVGPDNTLIAVYLGHDHPHTHHTRIELVTRQR